MSVDLWLFNKYQCLCGKYLEKSGNLTRTGELTPWSLSEWFRFAWMKMFCVQVPAESDSLEVDLVTASQSFPPVPSTVDQRPHTISSAYERSVHTRPSLGADTFTPLPIATSGVPASRSRPPSIHGGLPSADLQASASPYAVPCIVPKHRRDMSAGGAKVADIYARPALVGARSGSVRALPVATPTVPDFAGPLSPQAASSESES